MCFDSELCLWQLLQQSSRRTMNSISDAARARMAGSNMLTGQTERSRTIDASWDLMVREGIALSNRALSNSRYSHCGVSMYWFPPM